MLEFLARRNIELDGSTVGDELPFVYVFGRSSFAISFYGANVYPENVSSGVEHPELLGHVTGKFVLEVRHDDQQNAGLYLVVELRRGESGSAGLAADIGARVVRELIRQNSEFSSYVPEARRTPRVELRAFGDTEYFPAGVKHRYTR